jgi:hypothetical protein
VLTWNAIMSTIPAQSGKPLVLAHRDGEFTNKTLTVAALLEFEHTGNAPHPAENALPQATVTLETRFRRAPGERFDAVAGGLPEVDSRRAERGCGRR